jgi:hypothetical protein
MSLSTDTPVQAVTPIKQSPVLIGQFFLVLSFTCSSGGFNGKFIVIPWDGACWVISGPLALSNDIVLDGLSENDIINKIGKCHHFKMNILHIVQYKF